MNFKEKIPRYKAGVYQIKNLINNKIYIGSSVELYNRVRTHICLANKGKIHNQHLQNSISKYGIENFEISILEIVEDKAIIREKEQYYVDTLKPEYNKKIFVDTSLGSKVSEETKVKLSKTLKEAFKNGTRKVNKLYSHNKQVSIFNLSGNFIKSFLSLKDCADYLKVKYQSVTYALQNTNICKNHIVLYSTDSQEVSSYVK